MAVAGPTLWGSGASRRRQRPPDDTGSSQSCPGDSEQSPLPRHRCAYSIRNGWRGVGRGVGTAPIKLPSIAKISGNAFACSALFSWCLCVWPWFCVPRVVNKTVLYACLTTFTVVRVWGRVVSVRQTTTLVVRGLGRAFLCLSVCLWSKGGACLSSAFSSEFGPPRRAAPASRPQWRARSRPRRHARRTPTSSASTLCWAP